MSIERLFTAPLAAVALGEQVRTDLLGHYGVKTVSPRWRPPLPAEGRTLDILRACRHETEAAGQTAAKRMRRANPRLTGIALAGEAIPGMKKNIFLHPGPPSGWDKLAEPLQKRILEAIVREGLAGDTGQARKLAAAGKAQAAPCASHGAAAEGIISFSTPVFLVENTAGNNLSCAPVPHALAGKTSLAGLKAALAGTSVELKPLMARALRMGDELHIENAASSLLLRGLLGLRQTREEDSAILDGQLFHNISIAACRAIADSARGVEKCAVITAMSCNGSEFGIQVSCREGRWFTAPAPQAKGLSFVGAESGATMCGESVPEICGLGAFSRACPPFTRLARLYAEPGEDGAGLPPETCAGENLFGETGGTFGPDAAAITLAGTPPLLSAALPDGAGVARAPHLAFSLAAAAIAEELAK